MLQLNALLVMALATSVATAIPTKTSPPYEHSLMARQNLNAGLAAQAMNAQFGSNEFNTSSPCTAGQFVCINGGIGACEGTTFAVTPCVSSGDQCYAIPAGNSPTPVVTCTTPEAASAAINATGAGPDIESLLRRSV